MNTRLEGKVALITGGSSGIGRGIAKRFIEEGAQVAVVGRDTEKLKILGDEMGENLLTLQGDVTSHESLVEMITAVKQRFGVLNTLICSAGVGNRLPLQKATLQEFDRTFNVDVRAIFDLIKLAADELDT